MKIIVFSPDYFKMHMEELAGSLTTASELQVVGYDDFEDLLDLYPQYEDRADCFLFTSATALYVIKKKYPDTKKKLYVLDTDSGHYWQAIAQILASDQPVNPKRIPVDFLLFHGEAYTIDHLVTLWGHKIISPQVEPFLENASLDELLTSRARMAQKLCQMWDDNEIDMVFCGCIGIIPWLEKKKIPFVCAYPSRISLAEAVSKIESELAHQQLQDLLPSVILVARPQAESCSYSQEDLRSALLDLKTKMQYGTVLEEINSFFYIHTTAKAVSILTKNLTICGICDLIKRKYAISPVSVGYGIGKNLVEARNHAELALRESFFRRASFYLDDRNVLIGPLDGANPFFADSKLMNRCAELAQKACISSNTMRKIMFIVDFNQSAELTAPELAHFLGVTVRNSNRILASLTENGVAEVIGTRLISSTGRPSKVYRLNVLDA